MLDGKNINVPICVTIDVPISKMHTKVAFSSGNHERDPSDPKAQWAIILLTSVEGEDVQVCKE